MIGWIIGLALPALAAGGLAAVLGPAPALALAARAGGRFTGFLRSLTPRSWLVIAGVVALVVGFIWHQRHAAAELSAQYAAGVAAGTTAERAKHEAELQRIHDKAVRIRDAANALRGTINQRLRVQNDEKNSRLLADAVALFVHGPGRAAAPLCPGSGSNPGPSPAAGRHDQAAGSANAAVVRVPGDQWVGFALVPWDGAVAFGRQHDANQAEAATWRQSDAQQRDAWAKFKAEISAAAETKGK